MPLKDYTKIPQPVIAVRGSLLNPKDAFLVVEYRILSKITDMKMCCLALLSSFFVFNMHYTETLTNFYTFLECLYLGQPPPKSKTKVRNLVSLIGSMQKLN